MVQTLLPVLAAIAMGCCFFAEYLKRNFYDSPAKTSNGPYNGLSADEEAGTEDVDRAAAEEPYDYGSKYLTLFLYLTYLVLPSVTTTIFSAFSSFDANPSMVAGLPVASRYLAVDYSIAYQSPRYYKGVVWAIVMIFVYPIGSPVSRSTWHQYPGE